MDRSRVEEQYRWDLAAIFADDAACERELRAVRDVVAADPFAGVRGRLAEGPAVVRECLQTSLDLFTRVQKLSIYASCHSDEDTRNTTYQALRASVQALHAQAASCASFIEPELLGLPDAVLDAYVQAPELALFRMSLVRIVRGKPHVLGAGEEKLLSSLSDVLGVAGQVFGQLTNADFDHGDIEVGGVVYPVTSGRYGVLMRHSDRRVRQLAHEKMSGTYIAHKNAISALYAASVRKDVALARARNHATAREAALFRSTIPVSVYDALVEGVRAQIGHLHRYMELRRTHLGLDAVEAFDRNVPLADARFPEFAFQDAFERVVAGMAPLGEEYREILERARRERWVDVYETPGKRSGAYSTGFHATHPYVLLNYHGDIGHVLTLAHELGHSCHTYLSCANQPPQTSDYPIFLAEIASTANEQLLIRHLLQATTDPQQRAALIDQQLLSMTGTIYRQTMFAEFEWRAHERVEQGESLTYDRLCELYGELNRLYAGPAYRDSDLAQAEWMRIPHFYRAFYVFQYATGMCAAVAFADRILSEGESARERYLGFLKAGSSAFPLDVLKTAGLDMTDPGIVAQGLSEYGRLVNELETLLG